MSVMDTATVLFTDLVDSTALRARVGEDAADELRRTHDRLLADAVARHGGEVVKGLGDGVMATFGSAADAVAAAVAVQQDLHVHNHSGPHEPLVVRIGLSAGDILREDGDCFGRPVIEASRLCAAADGGQILVADVVRLLARQRADHGFRPLGEREVKGLPEPLAVAEVTWSPPEVAPPTRQLPMPDLLESGSRLDFSGRDEEFETVVMAWKQALTGERQAVLIAGEPGIGKTRLAREAGLRAHEQGGTVLYGRCEEDLGAPYQPFIEALDFFVHHLPAEDLPARLGRYPGELVRLCPSIADLAPSLPPPLRSDPETERYRLFEAIASWLAAAADPDGLVLVLDDVHWATRPTLMLLQHVLHATATSPLLLAATYRDTDLDRTHPLAGLLADLRRNPGVQRLALSGLDREGVLRLVTHAAGHALDEEAQQLAAMIHAETEGNPFFVTEILRHLRESGAIYQHEGRWVAQLSTAAVGIPEGVREVVGRRLDRLPPDANAALSTAAVVGRDFDLATVVAVSGLDEDVAVEMLESAVEARLVEERGVGRYRFAHALVRSTLYDELSATRRARVHQKVAEFVETARPDDVAVLAHHFANGSVGVDLEKALRYTKLAGDRAREQLAHDRAVDYYRQALELLDGAEPAHQEMHCAILVALGDAQRFVGDPGYRQTLLDAAALARRTRSVELLVQAALINTRGFWSMAGQIDTERMAVLQAALDAVGDGDSAARARLLSLFSVELMFSDEHERRHHLADEAVAVARRVGDRIALADVLAAAVPSSFVPWRMDVAIQAADELLALVETIDDPQRWALANLWSFIPHLNVGDVEIADRRMAEVRRMDAELGQPTLHWLATAWWALRTLMAGDIDEAERLATEAYEFGERTGQPDAFTWYAGQLWVIARDRGQLAALRDTVEAEVKRNPGLPAWQIVQGITCVVVGDLEGAQQVLDRLAPDGVLGVPRDVMWIYAAANLLLISEAVGDAAKASRLYAELLPFRHLPVHGGVTYQGSAELYLAGGARAAGDLDTAVEHLDAAVAFEERVRAPIWTGVAWADLARTLRTRGSAGDAERAQHCEDRARELAASTGSVYVMHRLEGRFA